MRSRVVAFSGELQTTLHRGRAKPVRRSVMSKGDVHRIGLPDLNATLELLARCGVTQKDFEKLRKASTWMQSTVSALIRNETFLWSLLELGEAFRRVGYTESDMVWLAGDEDKVREILAFMRELQKHVIDLDAYPNIPAGFIGVETHNGMGKIVWDLRQVTLYLSSEQQFGKWIKGTTLREELRGERALNANVLDYLLAHLELIPESWKDKVVYFWGTIYRVSGGHLCVRYLCWDGARWCSGGHWLGGVWGGSGPAALLASPVRNP